MKFNVFYSWQSDIPDLLIEKALEKVVHTFWDTDEIGLELAVDRDTKSTAGTPDIFSTIFDKISKSQIFVGDISIICETAKKKMPNSNVLIELGYAAAELGWEKIICLFNDKYGKVEELPFDLRSRKQIVYNEETDLEVELSNAIKSIIEDYKNQNLVFFGKAGHDPKSIDENTAKVILENLKAKTILKPGDNEINIKVEDVKEGFVYFASPVRLGEATGGAGGIDGGFVPIRGAIKLNNPDLPDLDYNLYGTVHSFSGEFRFQIKFYD